MPPPSPRRGKHNTKTSSPFYVNTKELQPRRVTSETNMVGTSIMQCFLTEIFLELN